MAKKERRIVFAVGLAPLLLLPALAGKEKTLHTIVYVWCAVVGISRVFMGAHFASDVTVGVLLSLTIFEVLRAILYRKERMQEPAAKGE